MKHWSRSQAATRQLGPALACCLALVLLLLVGPLNGGLSGVSCGSPGGWIQRIRGLGNRIAVATRSFEELLQLEYDSLNNQLVDEVPLDDPLDNLFKALEWLSKLSQEQQQQQQQRQQQLRQLQQQQLTRNQNQQQQQQQVGSRQQDDGSSSSTSPMNVRREALVRLTSLLKLMDEKSPQCNPMAYDILSKNEQATGSRLMVPDNELGPTRRIESIIRQVAVGHAEQCRYEYPKKLKWTQQDAAKRPLEDLRRMLDAIIETSQRRIFTVENRHMDRRHVLREKAKGISLARMPEARALLGYLRDRAARDDPDSRYLAILSDPKRRGRYVVVEEKVHGLLQKYGFQRCEYLMRAFRHILRPAAYEQQLSPNNYKYRAINEENAELLIFLEYYKLCDEMLERHKPTLQRNVVRAIWEEAEVLVQAA